MTGNISVATVARKRTLYLGVVDSNFDIENDIASGPYCFLGREEQVPEWRSLSFVDAFNNKEQIYSSQKDLLRLINHLMPGFAAKLNARHGSAYSVDFWRIIIFPWALELAQSVWTQFNMFTKLVAEYSNEAVQVPLYRKVDPWRFHNVSNFMTALLNESGFNLWFDSQIIERLAPSTWHLYEAGTVKQDKSIEVSPWKPGLARRIKLGLGYGDIIGTRFGGPLLAVFANLLPGSPSNHTIQPEDDFNPDKIFPRLFLDILDEMMDATQPQSYGDGFQALVQSAERFWTRPGRLRLGTLDLWNDGEKIVAALSKEAGEKLVICQHGGGYATAKFHVHTTEYEYRNGTFITWGWSDYEGSDGRFVPLPSPALGNVAWKHRGHGGQLILVGDPIRLRMLRLNAGPLAGGWVKYCEESRDFIAALPDGVRNRTSFRPYMGTATDISSSYITDAFPDVPLIQDDFHEAMLDARLIVLRGPGSTLNYAMVAGTPTVIVWNPDMWPLEGKAESIFQDFYGCGIVFDDAEAAARHIESVWDDIDGWWQSDMVCQARQRYIDRFARSDRWWWWRWAAALIKLRNTG
ncbi:MAG: hypothetical protein ISR45_06735 [Rhodospirillales bacterium]|nr:hypothetical protein [Rhodospirillales bacterium]